MSADVVVHDPHSNPETLQALTRANLLLAAARDQAAGQGGGSVPLLVKTLADSSLTCSDRRATFRRVVGAAKVLAVSDDETTRDRAEATLGRAICRLVFGPAVMQAVVAGSLAGAA